MNYSEILFQLSSEWLCRAIAWDAIVLGGNKQGGKLSGDNYVKATYLGSIIRGQLSGWQLFWGNYQYSIILWGKILSANCPRSNYLGVVTGEEIVWGAIVLLPLFTHFAFLYSLESLTRIEYIFGFNSTSSSMAMPTFSPVCYQQLMRLSHRNILTEQSTKMKHFFIFPKIAINVFSFNFIH